MWYLAFIGVPLLVFGLALLLDAGGVASAVGASGRAGAAETGPTSPTLIRFFLGPALVLVGVGFVVAAAVT